MRTPAQVHCPEESGGVGAKSVGFGDARCVTAHLRVILTWRGALAAYSAEGAPNWRDINQVRHIWQDIAQVLPHMSDILPFPPHLRRLNKLFYMRRAAVGERPGGRRDDR